MDEKDKIDIVWEKDKKGNLLPEFREEQTCLRCNKKPALKDGSDEGEYYCNECIIARNKVDKIKVKGEESKNAIYKPFIDD